MNYFTGVTSPVDIADLITNGMQLVTIVAPFIVVALAIAFAPKIVSFFKRVGK